MQTCIPILTSQDERRTFKMSVIDGIKVLVVSRDTSCVYVLMSNGYAYEIGEFNSEKKAKEIMEEIWSAIFDDVSYIVPQEVNNDRTES